MHYDFSGARIDCTYAEHLQLGGTGYKNIKMLGIDTLRHGPLDFHGLADATSTMFPTAQTTDISRLSSDKGGG